MPGTEQGAHAHDATAERALLGAMLLASTARRDDATKATMAATVEAEQFYLESHRAIARGWLATGGGDVVQVMTWLREHGLLETAGGGAALSTLGASVPTLANWSHYHGRVVELARRRELRAELVAGLAALDKGTDVVEVIDQTGRAVTRVASARRDDATWSWREACKALVTHGEKAQQMRAQSGTASGWTWGNAVIDRVVRVMSGQVVVLGARAKTGKTDFVCQGLAATAAKGVPVLFVTLEMTKVAATARTLSKAGGPPELAPLMGDYSEGQREAMFSALSATKGWPLYVSAPGARWSRIEREIRAAVAMYGVQAVALDYLQLAKYGRAAEDNDTVGAIAKEFAQLTRELGIASILLSQLNRGTDNEEREPRMSDLRQSGQIEESADRVVLMHRPNRTKVIAVDWTQVTIGAERWGKAPAPLRLVMQGGKLEPYTERPDDRDGRGTR